MLTRGLIFMVLAVPAWAQTYLPQPDLKTAQDRSAALWQAVQCQPQPSCDVQQVTKYLLPVQPMTDGTAAIMVPDGIVGGVVSSNKAGRSAVLTAPEQAAIVTKDTLGTKLPWVITLGDFQKRLTAPQLAAMDASVDPAVATPWTALKKGATVDLTDSTVAAMVKAMTADAIVTPDQAQTLLAPVAVAAPVVLDAPAVEAKP